MDRDVYRQLGKELCSFFQKLHKSESLQPNQIRQHVNRILEMATLIGDPLKKEAVQLNRDVEHWLKRPDEEPSLLKVREQALKLEQETREI